MAIPNPNISPDYVDKAWAEYQNLLIAHEAEIIDLTDKFEFYKDNAYANIWSNKTIMIDSKTMFIDWCLDTTEVFIDIQPETFGTILFWKEYWTFTLLVMAQMFISKMAERLSTKLNEPNWKYRFQVRDGHCDLQSVMVHALNAKTGLGANPIMTLDFPSFHSFKTEGINNLETGNILVSYCPDTSQAPSFGVPLYNLGRVLKREYIERCDFNIK